MPRLSTLFLGKEKLGTRPPTPLLGASTTNPISECGYKQPNKTQKLFLPKCKGASTVESSMNHNSFSL